MKERIFELIHSLAYDLAKDEAIASELFCDEDQIRWINDCCEIEFHDDFKPIYDRYVEYLQHKFEQYGF